MDQTPESAGHLWTLQHNQSQSGKGLVAVETGAVMAERESYVYCSGVTIARVQPVITILVSRYFTVTERLEGWQRVQAAMSVI